MASGQITEDDIAVLTALFYERVRKDGLLGPIFNEKIGTDDARWAKHIAHINDFWSGVFLQSGRFTGNPMAKHATIFGLTPEHFTHWLALFDKAALVTLPKQKAQHFHATAKRIAASLQMGLAFYNASQNIQPNPFENFNAVRPSRQEERAK